MVRRHQTANATPLSPEQHLEMKEYCPHLSLLASQVLGHGESKDDRLELGATCSLVLLLLLWQDPEQSNLKLSFRTAW